MKVTNAKIMKLERCMECRENEGNKRGCPLPLLPPPKGGGGGQGATIYCKDLRLYYYSY